ncbi:MAG: tetratricopeptide repeat protein, partial [Thermoanaerobaculia bacterium]
DFGLAKFHLADKEETIETELSTELLTGTGRILGTMPYMSPEQLQGKPVDSRSDIFSFGTVLYTMATGSRPFSGESSADLISSILKDTPTPVTELKGELPRHLARVIRHCLEKDPSHRFQTALDVRNELEELKGEVDAGEAPTSDFSLFAKPARRISRTWLAVGAVAVIVGLLAAAYFIGRTQPTSLAPELHSLAVMPLANLTGDSDLDHVAEGISAGLITQLTEVAGLRVMGRSEAWSYRDQNLSQSQLAKKLGVGSILDGELQQAPDSLKVDVQLTDVRNNFVLWSETVDGARDDPLDLQRQIAGRLIRFLKIPLSAGERRRMAKDPTKSLQAYDHYLRGQQYLEQLGNPESNDFAIGAFKHAIRIDPAFALAHVGLSEALCRRFAHNKTADSLVEAEAAAKQALELDPELPAAQVALARVYGSRGLHEASVEKLRASLANHPNPDDALREIAYSQERQGNLEEAERSFREAVALGENYWVNWNRLGKFYASVARYDQAREAFQKAAALAPSSISWPRGNLAVIEIYDSNFETAIQLLEELPKPIRDPDIASNLGVAYYFSDRPDSLTKAEEYFAMAVRLNPQDDIIQRNLADVYLKLDRREEAREHYLEALRVVDEGLEVEPQNSELKLRRCFYLARASQCTQAVQLAHQLGAELPETADNWHDLAAVHAICAQNDEAVSALKKALRLGFPAELVREEDEFQSVRESAAFQELTGGP